MNDDEIEICSCNDNEWEDDLGDGWVYCASCHKLARPKEEDFKNKFLATAKLASQEVANWPEWKKTGLKLSSHKNAKERKE